MRGEVVVGPLSGVHHRDRSAVADPVGPSTLRHRAAACEPDRVQGCGAAQRSGSPWRRAQSRPRSPDHHRGLDRARSAAGRRADRDVPPPPVSAGYFQAAGRGSLLETEDQAAARPRDPPVVPPRVLPAARLTWVVGCEGREGVNDSQRGARAAAATARCSPGRSGCCCVARRPGGLGGCPTPVC